jgi:hypothetical protein
MYPKLNPVPPHAPEQGSPPIARVASRRESAGMPPELAALVATYAAQQPPSAPKPPGYSAFHDESRS